MATRLIAAAVAFWLLPFSTSAQSTEEIAAKPSVAPTGSQGAATSNSSDKQNHWGVTGGFATWDTPDSFEVIFDAARIQGVKGRDFDIGVAHGSTLGGHLRLLYVRKRFDKGATLVRGIGGICVGGTCIETGGYYSMDNAWFDGFEADKFISFHTFARRIQLGLNVGGGIGFVKGTTTVTVVDARVVNGQLVRTESSGGSGPASALIAGRSKYFPLFTVGPAVGLILAPGLKVQVGAGFNFPGTSKVAVSAVYLIGAK